MEQSSLFKLFILFTLTSLLSLPANFAMEEDAKGNKTRQNKSVNKSQGIKFSSYLEKLPAELLEQIFFYSLAQIKDLADANKSLNTFNNVIYKTCGIKNFINETFTKDPINLCSKCTNINPFTIVKKLRITKDLREKLKKIILNRELKKQDLAKEKLNDLLPNNQISDKKLLTKMFFYFLKTYETDTSLDLLLCFINAGVDIDEYGPSGNTALIISINSKSLITIKFLLNFGANPNIQVKNETALHVVLRKYIHAFENDPNSAEIYLWEKIILLLLDFGADPNIPDSSGHSILYYAKFYELKKLIDQLKNYGAKLTWKEYFSRS